MDKKRWNGIYIFLISFIILISFMLFHSLPSDAGMLNESVADVLKTSRYENARSELEFVAESVNRYMNYVVWLEKRGDTTLARPASSYENFVLGWLRGEIDDSDLADAGMVGKPKLGTGNTAFERTKSGKYGERIGTWNGREIDFTKYTAVGTHSSLVLSTALPDALTGHVSPPFEMVSGRLGIVLSLPSGMGFDSDDYLKTSGGTMLASITDDPAKAPGEKVKITGTGQVRFGEEPDRESTPVKQVACIRDLLVGIWDSDLTGKTSPGALSLLPVLSARYSERLSLDAKWPSFSHFKYILENDADARTLLEEVSKYVTIPFVVEGHMADVKARVAGKELEDWRNDWWISYLSSGGNKTTDFSNVRLSTDSTLFATLNWPLIVSASGRWDWGDVVMETVPRIPGLWGGPVWNNPVNTVPKYFEGPDWFMGYKRDLGNGIFQMRGKNFLFGSLNIGNTPGTIAASSMTLNADGINVSGMSFSRAGGNLSFGGTADVLFKTTPTFEKTPVAIIENGNAWKIRMGELVFGDAGESAFEDELSKTLDFDGEVEIDIPIEVDGKKIIKKKVHAVRVENPNAYAVYAVYPQNPVSNTTLETAREKVVVGTMFDAIPKNGDGCPSFAMASAVIDDVRKTLGVKNYVSPEWTLDLSFDSTRAKRTGGATIDMPGVRTMLAGDTSILDALPVGKTLDDVTGVSFKIEIKIFGKTILSEDSPVIVTEKTPWKLVVPLPELKQPYRYRGGRFIGAPETIWALLDRNPRLLSFGTLKTYWESKAAYREFESGYDEIPLARNLLFGECVNYYAGEPDNRDYGFVQVPRATLDAFSPSFVLGFEVKTNGTGTYDESREANSRWRDKIMFAPFVLSFVPETIRYVD